MSDNIEDIFGKGDEGAPEVRESQKIAAFPESQKGKRGGSKPGRPMPWNDGNTFAVKHGGYRRALTAEEQAEREQYEQELIADLGDNPSTAQRSIIRRASWLEIRLRRNERASTDGEGEIASEHCLAWINSQRLLLCALGLERKQRPGPSLAEYLASRSQAAAPNTESKDEPGGAA